MWNNFPPAKVTHSSWYLNRSFWRNGERQTVCAALGLFCSGREERLYTLVTSCYLCGVDLGVRELGACGSRMGPGLVVCVFTEQLLCAKHSTNSFMSFLFLLFVSTGV
jgi:hypothetical protein